MVIYASFGKKTAARASHGSVYFELRSFIRSAVNEINCVVARLLAACDQKERVKNSKLRLQALEITANKLSKNEEIAIRIVDKQGKLIAYVYKMQYEQCQKTLKLWDMDKYIDAGVTEYRAQASNIYRNTNIEIRGQNKKNEFFILALFSSIAEAKTFENQVDEAR